MSYNIYTSADTAASETFTITYPSTSASTNLTYDYSNINWTTGTSISQDLSGNSIDIKGDANIEGDLKVKGKSIVESLERIEERLAILRPNEELEEKWENLRGLRKMYMELEAEIKEKEMIWATLKK